MTSLEGLRRQWFRRRIMFRSVVDFALAFALVFYFNPDASEFWLSVLFVVLALWAVDIFFLFRSFVDGWLWLWVTKDKDAENEILELLRTNDLPPPRSWEPSRFEYLVSVADDPELEPNMRIRAALLYSSLNGAWTVQGMATKLQKTACADRAVTHYRDEAPLEHGS